MSDVFIVGGGYVGGLVATLLREERVKVTLGKRSSGPDSVYLNVLHPQSFPVSLRKATRIVYTVSADSFTEKAYGDAYVEGLRNVLNSLEHPERVIFISSTGVYAQYDGSLVDESSETAPVNFSGKKLLEGESLLGGYPGCALRFSGIYGPGRARLLSEVSSKISRARFESYTNRIHLEDCARAIVHLLKLKEIKPVYIGSDEQPAKLGEIMEFLACEMGVPGPEVIEEDDVAKTRGGNKRCSSALLRAEGFCFNYPTYREGFRAILRGAQK